MEQAADARSLKRTGQCKNDNVEGQMRVYEVL